MQYLITFLLVTGTTLQIGRGDCVIDTVYEDMKDIVSDTVQYAKDTIYEDMKDIKDIASDGVQYAKDTYQKYMPELSDIHDSVKAGYNNFKDSVANMTNGAEEIAKDSMDSIAKATDYV